jgi:hypothetical protein
MAAFSGAKAAWRSMRSERSMTVLGSVREA